MTYNVKALYLDKKTGEYVSQKQDCKNVRCVSTLVYGLVIKVKPYQILITDNNQDAPSGVKKVK